ncbi:MAG: response regulator transcription factor [Ferruginibacter sp.]
MRSTIIIYEDNDNLRESLQSLINLTDQFLVLNAFAHSMEAVAQVAQYNPDVILMDIDMPGMSGIEAVKRIRQVNKTVQVIMLTVFDDNSHVYDALCAGANGYLLKKYVSEKLISSISEVLNGGAPMSPGIARMIIANMQQSVAPHTSNTYQLTRREKEILTVLARGSSYKMIASEMNISIDTVRTHIKRIYEKLHVNSQTEAVIKAINEKLV